MTNNCSGSEAVHRIQRKLSHINPRIFPTLHDRSIPDSGAEGEVSIEESELLPVGSNAVKAKTFLTYHLRPNTKLSS